MRPDILVVEDEFVIAELLCEVLEAEGHGVCLHAPTVAKALEALESGRWRGALLDIRLNGELVFPVAEALRARGVPFVFSSGDGDIGMPPQFENVPVLQKPWNEQALSEVVRKVFREPARN
jgi:DNA-binding response OmpR family regulator